MKSKSKISRFDEYSEAVQGFAQYPNQGLNMVYPAMGLAGEAGEVCDKVKKYWRNTWNMGDEGLIPAQRDAIILEMGDVLWYLDALANEIGCDLSEVAARNVKKLLDRNARGVIKSEGDNR